FKSKAAQKNRTELVVMITPEILSNNSAGVTRELPRLAEPLMPGLEQKKSHEMPPAHFTPAARAADNNNGAAPATVTAPVAPAPIVAAPFGAPMVDIKAAVNDKDTK